VTALAFDRGRRLPGSRRPWLALGVLCSVQFLVVLDITIVNVALPAIETDLRLSPEGLQWVIGAYALVFGGFLLLGGRAADVLGSRRVFVAGLVLFTVSSLLAGVAWSGPPLVATRALQGLGAALVSPAALAMLSTTFPEGAARNRALGVWASVGGLAAAAGVLLGGVLTELLSWQWVFFANVPVGALAIALAPVLTRSPARQRRRFDAVGAVLATTAVLALVHSISLLGGDGAAGARAGLFVAVAGALLAAFVAWERRAAEPLVPGSILREPARVLAYAAGFVHGAIMLASFLLLTLAMQELLGYSPIEAGLGLLAVRGTSVVWARVAARAATRIGARAVLVVGMAALTAGVLSFVRVDASSSYAEALLPGLLVLGLAIPFLFVSVSILALAGVPAGRAGVASGLLNTSQWTGGAVGLALVSTVAGAAGIDAAGLRAGFVVCALLGVAGLGLAGWLALSGRGRARAAAGRSTPRAGEELPDRC
jgi:EmrB/QacA subfamily drug resistance transporter